MFCVSTNKKVVSREDRPYSSLGLGLKFQVYIVRILVLASDD
jgi:hypothetical protein